MSYNANLRMGRKKPLVSVMFVTTLMYLAFVFEGKTLFSLMDNASRKDHASNTIWNNLCPELTVFSSSYNRREIC